MCPNIDVIDEFISHAILDLDGTHLNTSDRKLRNTFFFNQGFTRLLQKANKVAVQNGSSSLLGLPALQSKTH